MEKALNYFRRKKRIRLIENSLPEVFYQTSAIADFSSFEDMLKAVAENSEGAVSEEFIKAYNETRHGMSFKKAVSGIIERNKSGLIEKSLNVLISAYETGSDVSSCLLETADEIASEEEMMKEQSAGLIIEKYTLLLSAGLIIPLILGILSGVINSINLQLPAELSAVTQTERDEFIKYAFYANHFYLLITGFISGFFIAYQSNSPEKKWLYAFALSACSLIVFKIVSLL